MSAPPTEAPSLLSALTRRPGVTVGVLIAATALGGALPLLREPVPTARATLLLAEPVTQAGDLDGRAYVRAQAAVARLPLVAVLTTYATDAVHPDAGVTQRAVEQGLQVSLASGETGLVFRMRHPDPEVAQYAADAAAYSYQRIRRARLRAEAAATVSRLDAVDRSLLALPAGLAREQAREEVALQRAAALVQRSEPDLGIVASVPAELDNRGVRRPIALATGLLGGLIPALGLGHRLEVRAARRAARGLAAPAPRVGRLHLRPGEVRTYDVLAGLLPPGNTDLVVVAVVSGRAGPHCTRVCSGLADAARRAGRAVHVGPDAEEAVRGLVLVALPAVIGRADAAVVLRRAAAVLVVAPPGRRGRGSVWAVREQMALLSVPVLAELLMRRRPALPALRLPRRRSQLRPPRPVVRTA